jgi:murein L,D-transpeptidase YcbB/YkuD
MIRPIVFVLCLFLLACQQGKKKKLITRDTTITRSNSFNDLFMDSVQLEQFISQHETLTIFRDQFNDFYKDRNYGYAWFDSSGLTEQASNLMNLQSDYITNFSDSTLANPLLDSLFHFLSQSKQVQQNIQPATILEAELLLTGQFFRYASKAYNGSDIDAAALGWFIPRKKADLHQLLDSAIRGASDKIYAAPNSQYNKLVNYLNQYRSIEKKGNLDSLPSVKKSLRKGDSSLIIGLIRQHLFTFHDLSENNNSLVFDSTLEKAVKGFQQRMGLTPDGVVGNQLIAELNVPIQTRIKQMLINLERLRWMPAEKDTNYILVNIPAFMMYVYDSGRLQFNMNVIVGTSANNTVIFNNRLQYVVFSPYWNVPSSIVQKEILPAMARNPNYLNRQHMEIVQAGKIPVIRQLPGAHNSLGLVKFLFPNNYNIYFHDTPNRNLFSQTNRSFSHGCIRVGEPKKLAAYLLRNDSSWTSTRIDSAMHLAKEKWVTLAKPVPVFIVYFTAWVDQEGKLNFRKDIYKHDEKLGKKLFQ